jgi:hypothetical protein
MAKVKKEKELLVRLNSNYDCSFDYPQSGFLEDIDFSEFKNTLIDRVIQQLKLFVIISFLEIEVGRRCWGIADTFTLQTEEVDFSRIKMKINYGYDYDDHTVYFIESYYLLKGDEVIKYKKVINQISAAQSKSRQESEREQYLKLKKKFENG